MKEQVEQSIIYRTDAWELSLVMFIIMMSCIYLGRKVAQWRKRHHHTEQNTVLNTTISAMFGLLAFLLAFNFSMSSDRFDTRRTNALNEANAISTALLRSDMYSASDRIAFRRDFRSYLEARILYYDCKTNLDVVEVARAAADQFGQRLWKRATRLSADSRYESATRQMIPALNEMFDISTSRFIGELARVPNSIIVMLFILSWASAFYLGYASTGKERLDWFLPVGFCLLISVVIYITLDLDRPRRGFIQMATSHVAMLEIRNQFRENGE